MRFFLGLLFLLFSLTTMILGVILAQGERDLLRHVTLLAGSLLPFSLWFFVSHVREKRRERERKQRLSAS